MVAADILGPVPGRRQFPPVFLASAHIRYCERRWTDHSSLIVTSAQATVLGLHGLDLPMVGAARLSIKLRNLTISTDKVSASMQLKLRCDKLARRVTGALKVRSMFSAFTFPFR